jgi:hypothetical protein
MTPVNTGDDSCRDSAKEGDVAKDNHFATKGDLAKDDRLGFSCREQVIAKQLLMVNPS